jgi:hypothetical protein
MTSALEPGLENRLALSEERLQVLEGAFQPLAEVRADWPGRVLKYAVDGVDDGVLSELGQRPEAALVLGVMRPLVGVAMQLGPSSMQTWTALVQKLHSGQMMGLAGIFRHLEHAPIELLARIVRLYQASVGLPPGPGSPPGSWLKLFWAEWPRALANDPGIDALALEQLLEHDGASPEQPYRDLFFADPRMFRHAISVDPYLNGLAKLRGLADRVAHYRQIIHEALGQRESNRVVHVLGLLGRLRIDPAPFTDAIVGFALSSAKTVRQAAEALVKDHPQALAPALRQKAMTGSTAERVAALPLLNEIDPHGNRAFLEERLRLEKTAKVRGAIEKLLGHVASPACAAAEAPSLALPPLPAIASYTPLGPAARQAFEGLCDEINRQVSQAIQRAKVQSPNYQPPHQGLGRYDIEQAFGYIQGQPDGSARDCKPPPGVFHRPQEFDAALQRFLEVPELQPAGVIRLLRWTGQMAPLPHQPSLAWIFASSSRAALRHYWQHHAVGFELGLRELAAIFQAAGIDPRVIGYSRLCPFFHGVGLPALDWEPQQTWPYFAEYPEILEEALDLRPQSGAMEDFHWRYFRAQRHKLAFEVLSFFPRLPERFVEFCWDVALGTAKTERSVAQKVLARAGSDAASFRGAPRR